jgi:hypothetical protein
MEKCPLTNSVDDTPPGDVTAIWRPGERYLFKYNVGLAHPSPPGIRLAFQKTVNGRPASFAELSSPGLQPDGAGGLTPGTLTDQARRSALNTPYKAPYYEPE